MGSIILCHKQKAKQPFEISRVHHRIYTIEELCYYICNHLYLIDHTIMNTALCDWLEDELKLPELAGNLRYILRQHGSVEQFVMTILASSSIYTTAELKEMQEILDKLKNQKPVVKEKYKADNLLQSGAIKSAILIYQSILHDDSPVDQPVEMDRKFYGKIYGCLGAAYGRLFLYKEAAKMYETAYQICEDKTMLKAFLYASMQYLSEKEYILLLQKSRVYEEIDLLLKEELQDAEKNLKFSFKEDTLEKWKEQYRKTGSGEM